MYLLDQNKSSIYREIENVIAFDATEENHKQFLLQFIRTNDLVCSRNNLKGHITASAWITNEDETKVLLIHHRKLNRWLQPGGHIEPDDRSLFDAALREAVEETNLKSIQARSNTVFDVDVHVIPERRSEPEHYHLDVRFCFVADVLEQPEVSIEVNDTQWVSIDKLMQKDVEESIRRMAQKKRNFQ